ncbi:MAG: carbohydrate ABC transporter permease [Lachnospiraceae bacterium]|nr:carbohydrate ABC transporter permease [Lachnospiraceae bacterium]
MELKLTYVEDDATKNKRKVEKVLITIILTVITALCLLPGLMLLINATRANTQLQSGFSLLPGASFFKNLYGAFHDSSIDIGKGLLNSFIIAIATSVLTCYFSTMCAYGIYVYDFAGKKVLYGLIIAFMLIPTQVSAVGYVQLVNMVGLKDSFIPLILPGVASPVAFFYMIQYMRQAVDKEIIEAARVDGSNEFRTFNRIIIPIMRPAIAVQGIFAFVSSWNNYFIPSLLINEKDKKTIPMMMATLRSTANSLDYDLGKLYMFVLISILPVIVVYLILSKSIIGGITAGAVKQ